MMNVEYKTYTENYEPNSIEWSFNGKKVFLEFSEGILGIYSEKLNLIIIELYKKGTLVFYKVNGDISFERKIPKLDNYEYRGIHKSINSKTNVSFLFHPVSEYIQNKLADTEQFELDIDFDSLVGKKLGIFR